MLKANSTRTLCKSSGNITVSESYVSSKLEKFTKVDGFFKLENREIMTESEQIVYISCLEEVRYSFVSHIFEALCLKRINDVFVDSDDLLSKEAQAKVERARVSVMILPGNHTVRLDKLVKVLECQRTNDQVVVPVLYGNRTVEAEWLSALDSKGFSSVHQSRYSHWVSFLNEVFYL